MEKRQYDFVTFKFEQQCSWQGVVYTLYIGERGKIAAGFQTGIKLNKC